MVDSSFVIVNKETGKPVCEIMENFDILFKVNIKKYEIVPIYYWLQNLNKK